MVKLKKSIAEINPKISKEKNNFFCYFIVLSKKYSLSLYLIHVFF